MNYYPNTSEHLYYSPPWSSINSSNIIIDSSNKIYYQLNIYFPLGNTSDLYTKYYDAIQKQNKMVNDYLNDNNLYFDAGFDLFCPTEINIKGLTTEKVNHFVQCSMDRVDNGKFIPVSYYLYPRSSTGTKTPLRLANSVGIIDSGYRGNIIAVFDNWKTDDYVIDKGNRIVQICPPDISYPLAINVVSKLEDLGSSQRGTSGFGSTGN
jgi:dUTP pyrophosphatase